MGGAPGRSQPPFAVLLWGLGTSLPLMSWHTFFLNVVHFSWWLRGDWACSRLPEAGHIRRFTERLSEAVRQLLTIAVFSLTFNL